MTDVWISAAGLCGTTVVGALLGLIIRDLPHKWNDIILGYCAGIMLAAKLLLKQLLLKLKLWAARLWCCRLIFPPTKLLPL